MSGLSALNNVGNLYHLVNNGSNIKQSSNDINPQSNVAENSGVLTNKVIKDVITANNQQHYFPGLVLPSMEANPLLLDKQIAQLSTTFNTMTEQESKQVIDDITENFIAQAKTAKVDIIAIANGFSGRAANILQIVIEAALEVRKSTAEQREATRQVSYSQGQQAAQQKIQAGEDARNNAITQGIVGSTMAIAGGAFQVRASTQSNNALKTHGNKSNELKRTADQLDSQASSTKGLKTDIGQNDENILKMTAKRMRNEAQQEDFHLNMRQNDAQKWQAAGQLTSSSAMNIGTLAAAQGQVIQAESLASEQRAITDQNMYASRSEAEERMVEAATQLKAELLQLLIKTLENRTNTISSMTNNVKA